MHRFAAIGVLILVTALATLHAQNPGNPFAPSGNPFGALGNQLTVINGKLDQIIKRFEPPPPPPPDAPTLSTGILEVTTGDVVRCGFANVSGDTYASGAIEFRLVRADGDAFSTWFNHLAIRRGQGDAALTSFGNNVYPGALRCEFRFSGSPESVRATMEVLGEEGRTAVLDAR